MSNLSTQFTENRNTRFTRTNQQNEAGCGCGPYDMCGKCASSAKADVVAKGREAERGRDTGATWRSKR